jgi:amino acid transporter
LSAIALLGLRPSAWVWNSLTLAKLLPLVLLLVLLFVPAPERASAPVISDESDFPRALLVALFPLQGFEIVPVLAGSTRGHKHTIPIATAGALVFASLLYAAIQLVCARALPNLAASRAPLAEAAGVLGGTTLEQIVAIGANVSAIGIAFGMIVMTPRYLAALGEHAKSLGFLARNNSRGVPGSAVAITFGAIALLASFESLESLFVLSSSAVLIQYVAASASLMRLSWRGEVGLARRDALPALLALFAIGLLARAVEPKELVVLGALLAAGLLVMLAAWARER